MLAAWTLGIVGGVARRDIGARAHGSDLTFWFGAGAVALGFFAFMLPFAHVLAFAALASAFCCIGALTIGQPADGFVMFLVYIGAGLILGFVLFFPALLYVCSHGAACDL